MPVTAHRLLFLCTGNYYRSRFAEMLFNHMAKEAGLTWLAESRGIAVERGSGNIGPLSTYAIDALRSRNIDPLVKFRYPLQVLEQDLEQAHLIIALWDLEHRPLLKSKFSKWAEMVEYWNIPDIPLALPHEIISGIEQKIGSLIRRLM